VDEGDPVKKGMVVARSIRSTAGAARPGQGGAGFLRVPARAATHLDRLAGRDARSPDPAAPGRDEDADSHLTELLNGSRSQEKEEAHDAVARAQTEYDRSANDWKRARRSSRTKTSPPPTSISTAPATRPPTPSSRAPRKRWTWSSKARARRPSRRLRTRWGKPAPFCDWPKRNASS